MKLSPKLRSDPPYAMALRILSFPTCQPNEISLCIRVKEKPDWFGVEKTAQFFYLFRIVSSKCLRLEKNRSNLAHIQSLPPTLLKLLDISSFGGHFSRSYPTNQSWSNSRPNPDFLSNLIMTESCNFRCFPSSFS